MVRLLSASSAAVYGAGPHYAEALTNEKPLNVYGYSKFLFDQVLRARMSSLTAQVVGLRYFNVYGPGQYGDSAYSTVISAWLESLYFPENKKSFIEQFTAGKAIATL